MKRKTKSTEIDSETLAHLSGYSIRHLRDLAKAGWFPAPENGRYQKDATLKGIIAHLRDLAAKANDSEKKSRAAYWETKRRAAQFDLEREQGEHVPKSVIGPALRNVSLNQRATLVRMLERELPPKLVALTELEIHQRMRDAVDEICAIFREGTRSWTDAPPPQP